MKTIFWDFNGTILDDLELCISILNEMLDMQNKASVSREKYLDIFTFPIKDYYKLAGFDFTQKSYEELSHQFITAYQAASLKLELHDYFLEMVQYFKHLGYKQVVLSASQHENLVEQLNHYGIATLFDDILGIQDIYATSKVQIGLDYIKKNDVDVKNSYMIGDTLHDASVAEALNCGIILYTKGHQAKSRFNNYLTVDSLNDLKKEIK